MIDIKQGLASVAYKICGIKQNEQLTEKLHKPIIKEF